MEKYFFNFLKGQNRLNAFHLNLGRKNIINNKEVYDYIIVGGGSAGCVLASRLSEMTDKKILLLESGPADDHLFISIPAAFIKLFSSEYAFQYKSVPQKNLMNSSIFIPQGNVLGGSSSINAMAYLRGSSYDYDNWAFHDSIWKWENCLKYFKKAENQQNILNNPYHGYEGPWKISDVENPHPLTKLIVKAIEDQMKLPFCTDFNGNDYQQPGVGFIQTNIHKGKRHSISEAYLTPSVLTRPNLFIKTSTNVQKVVFNYKKQATGVQLIDGSIINCNNEIILSAGVFNSPKILMLSGIGSPETLKSLNIPVIIGNKEVGNNLNDHPIFCFIQLLRKNLSLDILNRFPYNVSAFLNWLLFKDNELAQAAEMTGYFQSSTSKKLKESAPDLQIAFIKCIYLDHGRTVSGANSGYALGPVLMHPKSKGNITINSTKVTDCPIIDYNIYDNEEDLQRMLEGAITLRDVIESKILKDVNLGKYLIPSSGKADDINELKEEIKKNTQTLYHPVGTCAMGKVVNGELKLIGAEGIRVVDASIMPDIVRANTNAPVVMIAENISELIKKKNKK